jgi:succinyl-CoA synthetase beta subunit
MDSKMVGPERYPDMDIKTARELLAKTPAGSWLDQASTDVLMRAYGISVPQFMLATNIAEARSFSKQVGFPVVLKIASPDIVHKSDFGGVLLNIQNQEEAEDGFSRLAEKMRSEKPEARMHGVHLQHMFPDGQEVIIGSVRDAQFGPLMMFGSGGVEVEGLKDISFALAPLSMPEAEILLSETWVGRKLNGYRNIPQADVKAVLEIIQRLSFLVTDLPAIQEIEINPLRVFSKGAIALDVRVKL